MPAAPALLTELPRLSTVGAANLGICGDLNHHYGYHINSGRLPSSDYSMQGPLNRPVGDHCCALDIGMGWPAARSWIRWLIQMVREDRIQGVAEVIGSLDGRTARYWSDADGWGDSGVPYNGEGHVTWTHVGIYRSTAFVDHGLLAGWTPTGYSGSLANTGEDDEMALLENGDLKHGFGSANATVITGPALYAGPVYGWSKAVASLGVDYGEVAVRVFVYARGWQRITDSTVLRAGDDAWQFELPQNTTKVSVTRVKRSDADPGADVPGGYSIVYGK